MSLNALSSKDKSRLVLVQAAASQNALPMVRHALHSASRTSSHAVILLALATPVSYFQLDLNSDIKTVDWTGCIPGYAEWTDPIDEVIKIIAAYPPTTPLSIVCESIDTILHDHGSPSVCYKQLKKLFAHITERPTPSRLILSLQADSPLIPLITPPTFSPTLTSITLHSPLLIRHLADSYLTLPPPHGPPERFWSLFSPAAARREGERLAFGSSLTFEEDDIVRGAASEGVIEVLVRGVSTSSSKRGIERSVEGWKLVMNGNGVASRMGLKIVPWHELSSLSALTSRSKPENSGSDALPHDKAARANAQADPMASLSFNLSLTDKQQAARAQVPLPYAHEGRAPDLGAILYDPDSADDVDDDDPDEDLDI